MKKLFIMASILLGSVFANTSQVDPMDLSDAAIERTTHYVVYDGTYTKLDYPMGDVDSNKGVCTDVVIRAYRKAYGLDFQSMIHKDMIKNFDKYPQLWGSSGPDKNIDHRRTQNQEYFLKSHGYAVPITDNSSDYQPGDLVYYGEIGFGHVGIVVNKYVDGRPMVVHNIGAGPRCEDFLFDSKITGHYRFIPTIAKEYR